MNPGQVPKLKSLVSIPRYAHPLYDREIRKFPYRTASAVKTGKQQPTIRTKQEGWPLNLVLA
jgi:hypothetical protein